MFRPGEPASLARLEERLEDRSQTSYGRGAIRRQQLLRFFQPFAQRLEVGARNRQVGNRLEFQGDQGLLAGLDFDFPDVAGKTVEGRLNLMDTGRQHEHIVFVLSQRSSQRLVNLEIHGVQRTGNDQGTGSSASSNSNRRRRRRTRRRRTGSAGNSAPRKGRGRAARHGQNQIAGILGAAHDRILAVLGVSPDLLARVIENFIGGDTPVGVAVRGASQGFEQVMGKHSVPPTPLLSLKGEFEAPGGVQDELGLLHRRIFRHDLFQHVIDPVVFQSASLPQGLDTEVAALARIRKHHEVARIQAVIHNPGEVPHRVGGRIQLFGVRVVADQIAVIAAVHVAVPGEKDKDRVIGPHPVDEPGSDGALDIGRRGLLIQQELDILGGDAHPVALQKIREEPGILMGKPQPLLIRQVLILGDADDHGILVGPGRGLGFEHTREATQQEEYCGGRPSPAGLQPYEPRATGHHLYSSSSDGARHGESHRVT